MARPVTNPPTMKIRKAAGPSPTLKPAKSRPQGRHSGAKLAIPSNKVFAPQRGHEPRSATDHNEISESMIGNGGRRTPLLECVSTKLLVEFGAPAAPDIDAKEEEQPDNVDEVPVPGRRLEAEMLTRREM